MKKEEFLRQLEYLLQDIPEDDKRDAIDYYRDYLEEAGPDQEEEVLAEFGSPERIASVIRTDLLGGMESAGEFTDNGYDDRRFRTSAYPVVNDGKKTGSAENSGRPDGEQKEGCHSDRGQGSYADGGYVKGSYAGRRQSDSSNDSKWWKYLLIALGILFIGPFVIAAVFGAAGTATGFIAVLAAVFLVLAILTIAGILGGVAMVVVGILQLFGAFWSGVMSIGLGLVFGGAGCLLLCCSWLFYGRFLPWAVMGIVHLIEKIMHRNGGNSGRKTGV